MMLQSFEKQLANFFGTRYAIVTGSGRMSLQIALKSSEILEGNVIVSNLVCSILPQTIISTGLTPFFVDINKDMSLNLDSLENGLPKNTKVLLINYLYGCPTDNIKKLIGYAKDKKLFIIEDAAQSFGAKINGKYVGSFGDFGILSLTKIFFPLFRGGALITNDENLASRALVYRKQTQTNPNTPYIIMTYLRKKLIKTLPNIVKNRFRSRTTFSRYPNTLYECHEASSPYHFQNLTNFEIAKGIHALHNFEQSIAMREKIVKNIYAVISNNKNLCLQPLIPYQEDYVYTRIPVLVKENSLHKWIAYFYKQGEIIDLTYRPLSNNTLFRKKSVLSKNYFTSEELSTRLMPLPVNSNVLKILENFDNQC